MTSSRLCAVAYERRYGAPLGSLAPPGKTRLVASRRPRFGFACTMGPEYVVQMTGAASFRLPRAHESRESSARAGNRTILSTRPFWRLESQSPTKISARPEWLNRIALPQRDRYRTASRGAIAPHLRPGRPRNGSPLRGLFVWCRSRRARGKAFAGFIAATGDPRRVGEWKKARPKTR